MGVAHNMLCLPLPPAARRQANNGEPLRRVTCLDPDNRRALLEWAAETAEAEAPGSGLRALLAARNTSEATPLFTACHFCVPEVVEWLVELAETGALSYGDLLAATRKGESVVAARAGRVRPCDCQGPCLALAPPWAKSWPRAAPRLREVSPAGGRDRGQVKLN
jgi:hypothetical protein